MFAYCVAAAYQEAAFRGASQAPRCASRRAPKGAVQERIHCLDDGGPVGTFGRQQQAATNKRLDFARAQFQPIAAKAGAPALPVATHPLAARVRATLVFATIGVATLSFTGRLS